MYDTHGSQTYAVHTDTDMQVYIPLITVLLRQMAIYSLH